MQAWLRLQAQRECAGLPALLVLCLWGLPDGGIIRLLPFLCLWGLPESWPITPLPVLCLRGEKGIGLLLRQSARLSRFMARNDPGIDMREVRLGPS